MKRAHIVSVAVLATVTIVFLQARYTYLQGVLASRRAVPHVTHNISACLMAKDDNDKMVEWVAYHHFTLPLTRMVVCEEPANREYIKDRFANTAWGGMVQVSRK